MIGALARAVGQLSDPRLQRVIGKTLIGAIIIFVLTVAAAWLLLANTTLFSWGWLEDALDLLGGAAALVLGFVLFPAVVAIVLSLFLDEAVDAVEDRHYPGLPPARPQPLTEILWTALAFAAVAVVLNLLVLPLYFIPGVNLFVFYGLNGYLLGREYYEMVAFRRLDPRAARSLRRERRLRVFAGGVIVTILLSIPIVGLFMPVVAVAFMVHVFHGMRRSAA